MNRLLVAGLVGAVLGLATHASVVHRGDLNALVNKILGARDTVSVDSPQFCEALKGRKTMFRLRAQSDIEVLIPASSEEEAKLMLMMRYALLNKQDVKERLDEVNVEGCPGTGLADEPVVEDKPELENDEVVEPQE